MCGGRMKKLLGDVDLENVSGVDVIQRSLNRLQVVVAIEVAGQVGMAGAGELPGMCHRFESRLD